MKQTKRIEGGEVTTDPQVARFRRSRVFLTAFTCLLPIVLFGGAAAASEGPERVEWRLVVLGNATVPALPGGRQPSLRLDQAQKRVTGYAGCNNFFGSYELAGTSLKFGPLAATRRACPEPQSSVETKYLEALAKVRGWKLEAGELLLVANSEVLARLTTKPANASAAKLEALTFHSKVYKGAPVKLAHGEYRAPAAPGSASEVIIKLGTKRAFGTLNGRESGAVIVTTSLGGTGTFYELALLTRQASDWVNTDTVLLGDRINMHSLAIDGGQIVVAMTVHGPKDPMCCPTLEVQKRWSVRDGHLVAVADSVVPGQHALTGTTWQWAQTRYNNDTRTVPAKPEKYTIRFREAGQIDVRADCNRKGGTYSLQGKQLSIKIITSTMAACEPGSLENEFVRNLTAGTNYFFRGGNLYVDLKFDTGTMRFSAMQQK
jgi:heat shock protein HslJ